MPMRDDLAALHEQLAVLQREVERSREQSRRFEQLEAENAALRARLEKLERTRVAERRRPTSRGRPASSVEPAPITLRVHEPSGAVRQLTLSQRIIQLGSAESCAVRLDDPRVAPVQAAIENRGSEVVLVDLDGATLVNGELVDKKALQEGDELRLGDSRILVAGLGESWFRG